MGYNTVSLPQWQNLVRRLFGLTGPGGNVPTVAPEIQPVVILQPALPEHRVLRDEFLGTGGISQNGTGVAAGAPLVGVLNPSTSGKLVIIERCTVQIFDATAEQVGHLRIHTEAQVGGFGQTLRTNRDTRREPSGGPPVTIFYQGNSNLLAGVDAGIVRCAASNVQASHEFRDYVLTPGFALTWAAASGGINARIGANFEFYERPLENAERKG